ncbi:MAG: DNA mismatch repair endonuclease MutL [Bacteroidota bacterium]
MPDIIHLLPDSIANQIAAGEVIQRPASAVKELLENAIDAGATNIELIIKDAGKTLIQIIDNGSGMSDTDARLSFERHATSKINTADDLFCIRTMGFRGEALASIAAIAQVELKSKRHEDELGTQIIIEGSEVKSQEVCQCASGTSFSVKNLFFNVPARRNFLKADNIESNHITEEFYRTSLINPQISFSYHHNNKLIIQVTRSTFKQRIINLFGKNFNERLLPVEQETNVVTINGFIGKPEFARKVRGEQYFFVNKRFIKHPYLHHAVENAFQELIPEKAYPTYFIQLEIDPKLIDINIHPTKTEVKFQDEKAIYAMLRSVVKQTLGKFSMSPSIDFEVEQSMDLNPPPVGYIPKVPTIKVDPYYNPFDQKRESYKPAESPRDISNKQNWEKLFDAPKTNKEQFIDAPNFVENTQHKIEDSWEQDTLETFGNKVFQIKNKYIVTSISSGILIIDQQRAHERILYETFIERLNNHHTSSQQELFPQTITFNAADADLLNELKNDIHFFGFEINDFGKNTFIINGIPSDFEDTNIKDVLEGMLDSFKKNMIDVKVDKKVNLALSLARNMAIKPGKKLSEPEIQSIIDRLFACKMPEISPSNKKILITVTIDELTEKFK